MLLLCYVMLCWFVESCVVLLLLLCWCGLNHHELLIVIYPLWICKVQISKPEHPRTVSIQQTYTGYKYNNNLTCPVGHFEFQSYVGRIQLKTNDIKWVSYIHQHYCMGRPSQGPNELIWSDLHPQQQTLNNAKLPRCGDVTFEVWHHRVNDPSSQGSFFHSKGETKGQNLTLRSKLRKVIINN